MALGKYSKARAMLETSIELLAKSTSLKGERLKAKEKSLQKILQGWYLVVEMSELCRYLHTQKWKPIL